MAPSVSGAVLKLQYPHRFVQNGTCTYNPSSLASGTLTARMEEEDEDGLSAIRKCIFGYAEPGRISLRPPSVNPASWPPLQQMLCWICGAGSHLTQATLGESGLKA